MPTSSSSAVFKIIPGLQSYAWGKKGSSSLAAQLGTTSIPDFEIDDEKPYAEVCPFLLRPISSGLDSYFHHGETIIKSQIQWPKQNKADI
jgi:hypothetical protein